TVQDRMAWVTIGEYDYSKNVVLHYTNQNDVDHTVAYAKHCGLNTLIIDNHVAGFAVYNSEVEGFVAYRDYKDFDIIAAFKKACDAEGLRLVVMVNAFSSGLEGVTYPENHYMSIYKDKYLLTNRGRVAGPDGVITLDPADEEIQRFNLAIVKEIAEKYEVDGIQADYMRYPLPYYYQEHNYEDFGYNESSKSGFIKKYGKDPAKLKISDPLWEKWCAFRRDIISAYQKRFYETVKAVNPELHVSFTCFADYRDRQIYTYQDVEKWAENGYADAIFPMIYGDTTEYQQKYAEEILPVTEHTQVVLGVGTYVKATHKSIEEQFIMPYGLYCEGISVFTLRYICTCGYDETVSNAFRAAATPTAASDSELIKASAEMITERIKAVRFALGYAGKLSDAESGALDALATYIEGVGKNGDFSAFSDELAAVCADIESDTALTATAKEALLKELNYIIGLK
ncbi:MAG: family 10 glycosylhydrolase, partial [Clostridia bacterium]|nr:family 10 glycosylhydrolase [Clostridia bacterium]